jgi:thiamine biosynthesis lipoprotein
MNQQLVTEITHRAMATEFAVILPGEDPRATEIAVDALDTLDRIESALSIYRPESEISKINAAAGDSPVTVNTEVFDLITRAVMISQWTDGAFDITAGPLVDCWGFSKRRGQKPSEEQIARARDKVGWNRIVLTEETSQVFLPIVGMSLNLGGIGKGYAIDCIAADLKKSGVEHFLIHGGKSTILASAPVGLTDAESWKIAIEHPLRPGQRLTQISLENAAVATSGSGKQFFHYRGKRLGHVIDPRTGYPSGDALSMTIITDKATDADALSTACFVQGIDATRRQLEQARQNNENQPEKPTMHRAIVVSEILGRKEVKVENIPDIDRRS